MNNKRISHIDNNEINQIRIVAFLILITIICVFGCICVINNNSVKTLHDRNNTVQEGSKLDWAKSYTDKEGTSINIEFKNITTDSETYDKLRLACNEYIDKQYTKDDKININTTVNVKDDIYIDSSNKKKSETLVDIVISTLGDLNTKLVQDVALNKVDNITETTEDNKLMHEAGALYLQDKLLIKYINLDGDMVIVASCIENTDSEQINTYGRNDIDKIFTNNNIDYEIKKTNISQYAIDENTYLNYISDILLNMQKNKNTDKHVIKYFTPEGYDIAKSIMNEITRENAGNLDINIIATGKSHTESRLKDRIFIQFKTFDTNKNKESIINTVIKINNDFKIFDLDIL